MKIKLSAIEPNPFRDPSQKLDEDKVKFLASSMSEVGFWENVPVRKHPTKSGKYQIPYGHHRVASLKIVKKRLKLPMEADFQVVKLDDGEMCRQMFLENMAEHRDQNFWNFILDMKGLLKAIGNGQITLDAPGANCPKEALRSAPSAIRESFRELPTSGREFYTAHSVAKFLGEGFLEKDGKESTWHIRTAIGALEAIELGAANEQTIKLAANKSERKCRPVVTEAIRIQRQAIKNKETPAAARKKAMRATAAVAKEIAENDIDIDENLEARARATARRATTDTTRPVPQKPAFNPIGFADQVSYRTDAIIEKLDLLLQHIDDREQEELPETVVQRIQDDYARIMDTVRERIAPRIKTKGLSNITQLRKA